MKLRQLGSEIPLKGARVRACVMDTAMDGWSSLQFQMQKILDTNLEKSHFHSCLKKSHLHEQHLKKITVHVDTETI